MPSRPGLLDRIDRYFTAAAAADARIEQVGGLDVPIGSPAWPHPVRPRRGGGPVTVADVQDAAALLRQAGVLISFEWVAEQFPDLAGTVRSARLAVDELPLLVSLDPVEVLLPAGVRLYVIGSEDPQLPRYQRLAQRSFAGAFAGGGWPGEAHQDDGAGSGWPGDTPPAEDTAVLRERIGAGRTVMMVAVESGEPVAVGSHQPVRLEDGEASEVVGVATLPRLRGRGLGAGLTSALVEHARQTADLVFLSAGDDDVARVYERIGFARVGTTCVAEPA
ncbi:GNAT family N-acetyltransferase [Modestobacter sp. I12A-02628]|uniref:GNAT family N-acetyltransferase n=1 Tax=Goekera deserti TaxID=2497753 RepID=A0A7K3WE53_9ACTN|nr:GNAT family N-acetyltransferase [Goekera deserti]MPQ99690.1 GNAT family N-acetyltransferase [Goekera deserti]NDI46300.1 GNAT family N-acetyltransferase [Goekera deserti]NEL54768.1 GNAT family N-acetyltransferase [Goekera deserti]